MVLIDSSVWVDHLRGSEPTVVRLLESARVLVHPFVIGELALGGLRQSLALGLLRDLPQATVADAEEVLGFIQRYALAGSGVGYVDAHLLASVFLTPGARLWTRDKRLASAAEKLGVNFP